MSSTHAARVRVGPGDGVVVARRDHVGVFPLHVHTGRAVEVFLAREADGCEAVVDALEDLPVGERPSFAIWWRAGDGHTIVVAGSTSAVHPAGRVDADAGVITQRHVSSADWVQLGVEPPTIGVEDLMDLHDGVVPGGSARIEFRPATALAPPDPATRHEAPDDEPEPVAADFEVADLGAAADRRAPLSVVGGSTGAVGEPVVMVEGIRCSEGHFNHLDASFCRLCGRGMVHVTRRSTLGPRPPVGQLVSDQSSHMVDRSIVVTREGRVPVDHAVPVILGTAADGISAPHALVTIDGWVAKIVDLGSTNGTFLRRAGSSAWEAVGTDRPVDLADGDLLGFGAKRMTFIDTTGRPRPAAGRG